MAKFSGRRIDIVLGRSAPGGSGGMFTTLAKQLITRRGIGRDRVKPATPTKPILSTSKEKEAEIKRTLEHEWMPSGLRLAKIRQLAAERKILGKDARDFLHRSTAGMKLDTSRSIQKFEEEVLRAEREVTADQPGKSPIKYQYRKGGDQRVRPTAKLLTKEFYQQQVTAPPVDAKADLFARRRERLNEIYSRLHPEGAPTIGEAPAPAHRPTAPVFQQPTPLSISATTPQSASPLFTTPTGGSHVPGSHAVTDSNSVTVGMPIIHHEPATAVDQSSAVPGIPVGEPSFPTPPSTPESTAPASSPVAPEPGPIKDAFGGAGENS